jgi:hypothetical protein
MNAPGHWASGQIQTGDLIMRRLSLFSAVAALALMAAPLVSPASAGSLQKQYVPTTQHATGKSFAFGGSADSLALNNNSIDLSNLGGRRQILDAPTHQTATSHSTAIFGDASATSVNTNDVLLGNVGGKKQIIKAPTTQTATASSVSIGGDASSVAANSNSVTGVNVR